jgi:hypothetical protein
MSLQASTFRPLPSRERLAEAIAQQREHVSDLSTYVCYLIPLAERCGDRVYDVASVALRQGSLDVTAEQLRELAQEFSSPEGEQKYRDARLSHAALYLTSCKGQVGTFSAE